MLICDNHRGFKILIAFSILALTFGCKKEEKKAENSYSSPPRKEGRDYFLPNIDLNNWKVTLPIGSPMEIKPPAILDYANNVLLKDLMYNDSTDGSLVFYTYPNSTTTNSLFSRTELREQMVPGSDATNWTFIQGGRIKGTLSVPEVSKDAAGNAYRIIVMKINGRLKDEQKKLIGATDYNAQQPLKIYWQNGIIRVVPIQLKNINDDVPEILFKNAWIDGGGFNFSENVGKEPFTLEVIASAGRLEIILNNKESKVYENIHMEKWNVFENYFKAGAYLQTTNKDAHATVKYYDLEVSH